MQVLCGFDGNLKIRTIRQFPSQTVTGYDVLRGVSAHRGRAT